MLLRTTFAVGGAAAAIAAPAAAAEMTLKIDLPRLPLAEYHRPYVAAWIEKAGDHAFAGNVAVWYDVGKRDNGGAKWLREMRSWWRASGHELAVPVDGVSGATRPAGGHALPLLQSKAVAALAPGQYAVVVEAAREDGGREVLRAPFEWPLRKADIVAVKGEGELAGIALEMKP
jgi:hypothetical protein